MVNFCFLAIISSHAAAVALIYFLINDGFEIIKRDTSGRIASVLLSATVMATILPGGIVSYRGADIYHGDSINSLIAWATLAHQKRCRIQIGHVCSGAVML